MEKIKFQLEDGTEAEFYVEEQTRIGGVAYLLVSDSQDDEATAYIFKDVSEDDSQEACYEMVEDEDEMQAVFKVFEQMLDDYLPEEKKTGDVIEGIITRKEVDYSYLDLNGKKEGRIISSCVPLLYNYFILKKYSFCLIMLIN